MRIYSVCDSTPLGVVPAAFESVHHAGDTLQTKLAVVLGVEGVVGLGEGGEMVVEDTARGGARGTCVDIGHSTGGIVKDGGAFQVYLFIPGTRRVSRATVCIGAPLVEAS